MLRARAGLLGALLSTAACDVEPAAGGPPLDRGRFTTDAAPARDSAAPVVESGAPPEPVMAVHFRKPPGWKAAYIYTWDTSSAAQADGGAGAAPWPGLPLRDEGGGWYGIALRGVQRASFVFNANDTPQTADIRWTLPEGWFDDWDRWEVDPDTYASCCAFPGGRPKALVMSFDDGGLQDQRLAALLQRYGLKGTFHLNSGLLGRPDKVPREAVRSTYAGHEVSAHSVTHPHLEPLGLAELTAEILGDRQSLEAIVGTPVRGLAYPFGSTNPTLLQHLGDWGLVYGRVVPTTGDFRLPGDLTRWRGTCHHTGAAAAVGPFLAAPADRMALFFVWGHSWELDANTETNGWAAMEDVCRRLSGRPDVWAASAIEIADYLLAMRALAFAPGSVTNRSSRAVWVKDSAGRAVEVAPGATMRR